MVGVGVGGIAGGMGGMGRTRVGVGSGGIAGVVEDIVEHIVAGFWHTHDEGSEGRGVGKLADIGGSEEVVGLLAEIVHGQEQVFHEQM